MPFGKYRGTRVDDLPDDYLAWLTDDRATGTAPLLRGRGGLCPDKGNEHG